VRRRSWLPGPEKERRAPLPRRGAWRGMRELGGGCEEGASIGGRGGRRGGEGREGRGNRRERRRGRGRRRGSRSRRRGSRSRRIQAIRHLSGAAMSLSPHPVLSLPRGLGFGLAILIPATLPSFRALAPHPQSPLRQFPLLQESQGTEDLLWIQTKVTLFFSWTFRFRQLRRRRRRLARAAILLKEFDESAASTATGHGEVGDVSGRSRSSPLFHSLIGFKI